MSFTTSTLTYDQENRLTKWEKGSKRSEWNYNGMGLKKELREYENGSLIKTERYAYDGTQIEATVNAANTTMKTFTRGLDLSGSMEGAGGIGGLLAMEDGTNAAYYFADGNGNVAALYGEVKWGQSTTLHIHLALVDLLGRVERWRVKVE